MKMISEKWRILIRMGTAPIMQRVYVDPRAFREHLTNAILIAGTLASITFTCCAFTIAYEVHSLRIAHTQGLTEMQRGMFSRLDSLLWKVDTFLVTFSAS